LVSKTAVVQLLKYLTVGVVSVGLETTLFWWLFHQLHIAWVVANSLAIFITFWFNFFLNRLWSFQSRGSLTRQLVLYVALLCLNLLMSNLIIYVLADQGNLDYIVEKLISIALIVSWNLADQGNLDYIVAKIISIALIVSWNFVLYKPVIYRR
jgi:putative flippase GtrA